MSKDTNEALRTAAIEYATMGFRVFPCQPGGKAPATSRGCRAATCDVDAINEFWTKNPTCNIGLSTDGLLAVDVDGAGNPWLQDQPEKLLDMAGAPLSLTPRGGTHRLFREPAGLKLRNTAGRLAPNVDTRGRGGYVVVPPSVVVGRTYTWKQPLDTPDDLQEPPEWLVESLRNSNGQPKTTNTTLGNITQGQRNAALTSIAGALRRTGVGAEEIYAALAKANEHRCKPPLPDSEVRQIAESVARYEPDEASVEIVHGADDVLFEGISCAELATIQYAVEFLIENTLVASQPALVGGAQKVLKTLLTVDMAISLATATSFLGVLPVNRAVTVGYMSGEGGLPVLQDYARRVAIGRGWKLGDISKLWFCDSLPQLDNLRHLNGLERFIRDHELELIILDPLYLCMPAEESGNVLRQGKVLRGVNEVCAKCGCTPVLLHHTKKSVVDPYSPGELADLAWSGFSEYAGQWIMISRRAKFDADQPGEHQLWLNVGGRAGHSALHAIEVHEGTRTDPGGRVWQVSVSTPREARAGVADRREAEKQTEQDARLERDKKKACRAMAKHPRGETINVLKDVAGLRTERFRVALAELLDTGEAVPCQVFKAGRKTPFDAYKLAEQ